MRTKFLLLFILIAIRLSAQIDEQQYIDSLVSELPFTKNDTAKARLYKKIIEQYSTNNLTEALHYAEMGMDHVTTMHWPKGIAVFDDLIGALYSDKGEYSKAIERYEISYKIHISNRDYYNAGSSCINIGTAYQRQSVYELAMHYYFEALKLAESINNKSLNSICYSNIAIVYYNQNNYDKSLEYQFKALEIQISENNLSGMAITYESIGNIYYQMKDTLNARKYYFESIDFYNQTEDNIGLASVYTNLSVLFTDYAVNLEYKLKAQKKWDDFNPSFPTSVSNLGNIALAYLDIVRYDTLHLVTPSPTIPATRTGLLQKAEEYLNRGLALSIETGDKANFVFLTEFRSELEAEKGNFQKAYKHAKTYHRLYDSIYSQENKNKIAAIEGQREIALRDKEIEINKLALSTQKKIRIALLAGIVLLALIGGLLFRQSRIRKKTNTILLQLNKELDEANKMKAKFFAILSHDLRSPVAKLISFLHLQKDEPDILNAAQVSFHQQRISTSANALLEDMETLLLWSKQQLEHFKPVKKQIVMNDLFLQLEKSFVPIEKITFRFINLENVYAFTDEYYLYTIMHNLTSNAVKATQQIPNAMITWTATYESETTKLSIQDNGSGFTREKLKSLLTDHTFTNTKSGFGWYLILDLAKAINCKIIIDSTGGGACLSLSLEYPYGV